MHVKVEQRHIEAAIAHAEEHAGEILYDICRNCPIAQALKEVIPNFDNFGYTEIKLTDGTSRFIDDPQGEIYSVVFNYGSYPYTGFPELEFDVYI